MPWKKKNVPIIASVNENFKNNTLQSGFYFVCFHVCTCISICIPANPCRYVFFGLKILDLSALFKLNTAVNGLA